MYLIYTFICFFIKDCPVLFYIMITLFSVVFLNTSVRPRPLYFSCMFILYLFVLLFTFNSKIEIKLPSVVKALEQQNYPNFTPKMCKYGVSDDRTMKPPSLNTNLIIKTGNFYCNPS